MGRHAFITHIYHGLETKADLAGYFNKKKHGRTRTEKGAVDEETTAPSPGSLILNQQKKGNIKKKEHQRLANS